MKNVIFVLLITLCLSVFGQDPIHPALCHTHTGTPDPAFLSIPTQFADIGTGDWIGVYDKTNSLCYGAEEIGSGTQMMNVTCFGDESLTEKKDGFSYGAVMWLFVYDVSTNKFYNLSGTYTFQSPEKIEIVANIKYFPIALYSISNVVKEGEIILNTDPDISKVRLEFSLKRAVIKPGGKEQLKIDYTYNNTSIPLFSIATGQGLIMKMWDGYYYKYSDKDKTVIINAVAKSNFSSEMLTDQLVWELDQSVVSNTLFTNNDFVFWLKGDEVWFTPLAEKVAIKLYRTDQGIEKLTWSSGLVVKESEKKFVTGYSRSWKGTVFRYSYYKYEQGKVSKTPIEGSFTL